MLALKEVLLIFVILEIKDSLTQTTTISGSKYERVPVKANSFNDIRTTHLGGAGYDSFGSPMLFEHEHNFMVYSQL